MRDKSTPHGMSEIQNLYPTSALTQQTFYTCIFQFLSLLQTEHLVDKWHNQYIDVW